MYEKIIKRLSEYENKQMIISDEELSSALDRMITEERSNSDLICDYELIDEAAFARLELDGLNPVKIGQSGEALARRLLAENRAIVNEKKRYGRMFAALIAVAVVAAGTFAVIATDEGTSNSFSKDQIEDFEAGTIYDSDGIEIISGSEIEGLNDIKMIPDVLDTAVLLPEVSDESDYSIIAVDYGIYKEIEIDFDNSEKLIVKTAKTLPDNIDCERVYGYDIHFTYYSGKYQAEFDYCGCGYRVLSDTREGLIELIGRLKEVVG